MTSILVLQHHPEEGLGSLAPLLAAAGFSVDLR
ncbi:MAG: type 1 glutamine amidotransferase, partial [Acidithiobacillus sp.]|nr:type 1 glutamine amidotransferase [Acidithiobacillus sp.]